jgi:hypothetical protein
MAEDLIVVNTKNAHTWNNTISAQLVQDEFVLPGEFPYPTYIATPAAGVACTNAGDDVGQLMAPAGSKLRIRRIRVEQFAKVTAVLSTQLEVWRVTTAGTAGTAITPSKLDPAAGGAGATAASGILLANRGTAGALLLRRTFWPVQTDPVGGINAPAWEWFEQPNSQPIIVAAGVTNGIVIRNPTARAGLTVSWEIEFSEMAF